MFEIRRIYLFKFVEISNNNERRVKDKTTSSEQHVNLMMMEIYPPFPK